MRYKELKNVKELLSEILIKYNEVLEGKESNGYMLIKSECKVIINRLYSILKNNMADVESKRVFNIIEDIRDDIINLNITKDTSRLIIEKIVILNNIISKEIKFSIRVLICAEIKEKWDSIESIYNFMKQDARFDPIIVRTPVFRTIETKDQGILKDVLYEDFLSPIGIPSIEYTKYDISKDKPDITVISQPYEFVTVEQFWPDNISKHSRLVYSPYYALIGMTKASKELIENMQVFNKAWIIAAQSEEYNNYYTKLSRTKRDNMYLIGLPKLDWIKDLEHKEIELPKGWESIVQGKKVILLNTWYDISKSCIKYLRVIIDWVSQKGNIILIWRKHPLMDTVTKLYYEDSAIEYLKELEEFANNNPNVIVDYENSCKYSFYFSDALISDFSSLIIEYLMLNRPILWMQQDNYSDSWYSNVDEDYSFVDTSIKGEGVIEFLNKVVLGEDDKYYIRKEAVEKYLSLCEGYAGKRLCETIWKKFSEEEELY